MTLRSAPRTFKESFLGTVFNGFHSAFTTELCRRLQLQTYTIGGQKEDIGSIFHVNAKMHVTCNHSVPGVLDIIEQIAA